MRMVALLSNAAFDSEDTELLGAGFEAAWEKLNAAGSALVEGSEAALTRELLAKRIIEMAKRGERNPDRLRVSPLPHGSTWSYIVLSHWFEPQTKEIRLPNLEFAMRFLLFAAFCTIASAVFSAFSALVPE